MKTESEKLLDKTLRKKVKAIGGQYIKLDTTFHAGLPDRMCLLPGAIVVFIEVKTTGKKPTRIQRIAHRMLRTLDFRVEVIDNKLAIEKFIEDAKQR